MKETTLTILTILVLSALALNGCEGEEPPAAPESGKKAPAFTLKSFDDRQISLSDYKGKIVVLEWFNDECPFVRYHYEKTSTMVDL
ncbi:MAG: peroxiredoxin family protein, partial [Planctomycetota bacterium]